MEKGESIKIRYCDQTDKETKAFIIILRYFIHEETHKNKRILPNKAEKESNINVI